MTGYEKLAALMGRYRNLAVYRRFSALSAKLLLHMQAELAHLENELRIISQRNLTYPERDRFDVSWEALDQAPSERAADLQRKVLLKIQEKLEIYRMLVGVRNAGSHLLTYADNTILRVSRVQGLEPPLKGDLKFLRDWLERPEGGDFFLEGIEAEPWEESCSRDLVALCPRREHDRFAQYLSDQIVPRYHRFIGKWTKPQCAGEWNTISEYDSQIFVAIGNTVCMILSSLIPTGSIYALYFLESTIKRLAVITATSIVFSFVMTVIVQGRRADVFAATTALAAVQVVFVGGFTVM